LAPGAGRRPQSRPGRGWPSAREPDVGAAGAGTLNSPVIALQRFSQIKNYLKNFSLLILGCLVALLALEVLLRLYNPLEIRFRPDRIVLPVHKRYIFDNTAKFPTKLPKTTIHTKNSLGFRGAPPPADFGDYLTIITIGGSTTECFYLSDGRTWPDLLGRELSREFNRVWVNNAGLDGATTYRHLILMEDYVVKLRPKVVLFLIGINDVGAGDIAAAEQRRGHDLRHLWHAVLYRSEVYVLGQNLYHYFIAQRQGLHHTEIDLRKVPTLAEIPAATAARTLEDYRTNSLPWFAQRLEQLVKICRDHGIEPVLITQPTLYGPGLDPLTGVNLATVKLGDELNGDLMFRAVSLYNGVTRRVAQEQGVLLIDLARELPRNSAYYYDYLHYTEAGARQVAGIIDRHLSSFLAARYPAFKKEKNF
jgi:lysophospholipase L1-like esterase